MIIPITGNVRIVVDVDEVDVDVVSFSLETDVDSFPVSYRFNHRDDEKRISVTMDHTITVTKAQIEADAGKPFENCTPANLRRAIRAAVVAHVKVTL